MSKIRLVCVWVWCVSRQEWVFRRYDSLCFHVLLLPKGEVSAGEINKIVLGSQNLLICNQLYYQLEPRVALESAQMKAQIAVKMKLATHNPILRSNVRIIVKKSESCYLFFILRLTSCFPFAIFENSEWSTLVVHCCPHALKMTLFISLFCEEQTHARQPIHNPALFLTVSLR